MKERIVFIDLLRGIAAALMILGHSFIEYPVNISSVAWCAGMRHFIYTFHMELFFLLAGIVYRCSKYSTFIKGKTQRILVPYAFFGIFTLLVKIVGGSFVNGEVSLGEGLLKFLISGGEYWFLYVMFLILAIYPLIDKALNRAWMKLLLMCVLMMVHTFVELPNILCLSALVKYLPYFLIGHCLAEFVKNRDADKVTWHKMLGGVISVVLFIVSEIMLTYFGEIVFLEYIRALSVIYVFYCIVLLLISAAERVHFLCIIMDFLKLCSKYSLQLYLFNGYILVVLRVLLCSIMGIESPIIIVCIIWVGNLLITLTACKWIIPRIPIVRRLCGL